MKRHVAHVAVLLLLVSSSAAQQAHFPRASWEPKPAQELGLDAARLEAVAVALGGRGCVVKDGYVVHSWGSQSEKSDWYSSAKPVLSTLLMFAMHEGKIASFDAPLREFGWELLPKDQGMTLRHLTNMTSGYARPEAPERRGPTTTMPSSSIRRRSSIAFSRRIPRRPSIRRGGWARWGWKMACRCAPRIVG